MENRAGECTVIMKVVLGGCETSLLIDTGSENYIAIPTEDFHLLSTASKAEVSSVPTLTAGGAIRLRAMKGPVANLAGVEFPPAVVGETKSPTGDVGLDFFERGLTTIDFPGNRLYFKPGKEFKHRKLENVSGVLHPPR